MPKASSVGKGSDCTGFEDTGSEDHTFEGSDLGPEGDGVSPDERSFRIIVLPLVTSNACVTGKT